MYCINLVFRGDAGAFPIFRSSDRQAIQGISMEVFGRQYSSIYDRVYGAKNYERECDFIEAKSKARGVKVKSILDLGCGTGGHALILANRGYKVTGVDRSGGMLRLARKKAAQAGLRIDFVRGDITRLRLKRKFDAVISMFAVMGYQTANAAVSGACKTAKEHLSRNGIFLFDCWNGAAVLAHKPEARLKRINLRNGEAISRAASPETDITAHTVTLRIKSLRVKGKAVLERSDETHCVRFFFPMETAYFLEAAGFREVLVSPFPGPDKPLTERDWNMAVIARRGAK